MLTALGCAADDPFDVSGPRSCEVEDQNEWVYWLMQEYYLWNDEVPELDPADFDSPTAVMKASRSDLDRWSRVNKKETSDAFYKQGKFLGLGYKTKRNEDDDLVVTFVYDGSPAAAVGMRRGDRLEAVNGFSVSELDELSAWSDITGPNEPGVPVKVEFASPSGGLEEVILLKSWIDIVTVPVTRVLDSDAGPVGYLSFMTFVEPSRAELDAAFAKFVDAGVGAVVIDLRYNSGGLLAVAKHMASLMAGKSNEGQVAYGVEYNGNLDDQDQVHRLDNLENSLELEHVVFLTTGRTASASELVINVLRPYVDVDVVGDTTHGKPVGSHSYDFCDRVIFPISFRVVNSVGVADYFDGIAPTCYAADDLSHQLGDPREDSLATALQVIESGECPTQIGGAPTGGRDRDRDDPSEGEGLRRLIGAW